MKTLYLECNMGCSGDMLLGALLELLPDPQQWLDRFHQIGLPRVRLEQSTQAKCGIYGTHVSVLIDGSLEETEGSRDYHHHAHHDLGHLSDLIRALAIPDRVKEQALAVYQLLAEAESQVHRTTVEQIHFHEVGSLDAVADIVGVCLLLDELRPDGILASPVVAGSGSVHCAHGILPVPAPATAVLLQGIPWRSGDLEGELCTPTGAALLKHFVQSFGPMPTLTVERIGIGTGQKDFPQAILLRAFWCSSAVDAPTAPRQIAELRCTLDDMTGEDLGFAVQLLLDAGALDVYTLPIQMKKNRPGIILCVTCPVADSDAFARLMLRHTTTAGVRKQVAERYPLQVRFSQADTPYGPVRIKHYAGLEAEKSKPEFEDLARAAREHNVPIAAVRSFLSKR